MTTQEIQIPISTTLAEAADLRARRHEDARAEIDSDFVAQVRELLRDSYLTRDDVAAALGMSRSNLQILLRRYPETS